MRLSKRKNNCRGYAMAETAAALAILIPFVSLLLYAVWQTSMYVFINTSLTECARSAARNCAIAYGAPPSGAVGSGDSYGPNVAPPQTEAVFVPPTTTVIQGSPAEAQVTPASANEAFSLVRINGVLDDNAQFIAHYTAPAPNNQNPAYAIGTVKVTATYEGSFPKPDVLGLSRLMKYKLEQSCTYPLEY